MKILYIITGLGVGGAERQVIDIADRFYEQGHDVSICYLTGPVLLRPKNNSIKLVDLKFKKTICGVLKGFFKLRSIISKSAPDVVHTHMVHANLLSRLVRPFCSIKKLINTAHSTNEGGKARMLAYRLTHSLADVTTNVTLEAVRAFEQKKACPIGMMLAIPNGIDTDIFKPDIRSRLLTRQALGVDESEKLILAIGRLVAAKDYENLIRAFEKLSREDDKVKLYIVGDGQERQKLIDLVSTINLSGKVVFLGVRSDVNKLYNAADIYALSSAWEGFGLVVAEAMATEKVVVATNCGGVQEVIGKDGFLVPIRDSQALTKAMSSALSLSEDNARALGKAARSRIIERYSIQRIVNKWEKIYRS